MRGAVGAPGPAGTGGSRRAQGKGTGAVLGVPPPRSAPSSGTLWALQVFSSTSALRKCACPLYGRGAPLGRVLNARAPGGGVPDPAGWGPWSSPFSPCGCWITAFINGSTALSSHKWFLLQLARQSACNLRRPGATAGSGLDSGEIFLSSAPAMLSVGWFGLRELGWSPRLPRGLCDSPGRFPPGGGLVATC